MEQKDFDSHENEILFSIIIPHYNSPVLLAKLIDTVPVKNTIQLIVVDDRSNQELPELEKVENKLLERDALFLKNNTSHKGAGCCRNIGLEKATGKWLVFADADDFFTEEAFECMERVADSDADILYFAPTSQYLNSDKKAERHKLYEKLVLDYVMDPSEQTEVLLRYRFLPPWSKMIKRTFIENKKVKFEEVPVSNDVMFSIKTAHYAKKIEAYKENIYCATRSPGTLTTKHDVNWLEVRVKVFIERYCFLKENLSKKNFDLLALSGKALMLEAFIGKYGIKEILHIYHLYRKNHVKVFVPRLILNDINEIKKTIKTKRREKKNL